MWKKAVERVYAVEKETLAAEILTVTINGTVLIISSIKDTWKICSQMFPWSSD